jgi:hypothetical protein
VKTAKNSSFSALKRALISGIFLSLKTMHFDAQSAILSFSSFEINKTSD